MPMLQKIRDNENSYLPRPQNELVNMWQWNLTSTLNSVLSLMTTAIYAEFWLLLAGKKSLSGYGYLKYWWMKVLCNAHSKFGILQLSEKSKEYQMYHTLLFSHSCKTHLLHAMYYESPGDSVMVAFRQPIVGKQTIKSKSIVQWEEWCERDIMRCHSLSEEGHVAPHSSTCSFNKYSSSAFLLPFFVLGSGDI